MIKTIIYPDYIAHKGITKNHRGFRGPWRVCGADTETVRGRPYTLQTCTDGQTVGVDYVTRRTILGTFVGRMEDWAGRNKVNIVYFHNLKFDLQALLYDWLPLITGEARDVKLGLFGRSTTPDVRVVESTRDSQARAVFHVFTDKTWFARLHLDSHRLIHVLDSYAMFKGSLEAVARLVGSPFRKLPKPRGLGERWLKGPAFERYIRNDVLAEYHVGRAIERMHQDYDVQVCVSAPHFAARVFRHHFMRQRDVIEFPPETIARAAELSYHGGKNVMTVKPGWYKSVYELDLVSAYTWAMVSLPPFIGGRYRHVRELADGQHGILRITGRVQCPYGCIFTHDFRKIEGDVRDVWVTTYEAASAVRHGCLDLKRVEGYVWQSRAAYSPLAKYARHFWDRKAQEKKGTLGYEVNKLLNNSLYGKYVQTVRTETGMRVNGLGQVTHEDIYRAGGLYNPVIATCITGQVRARIHDYEHKYRALHTSTDAVKTQIKPDPADLGGLGNLTQEAFGECLLLRPKLYVHYDGNGKAKAAYHGFQGDMNLLLKGSDYFLRGRSFRYVVKHCWTARQAMRRTSRAVVPLQFDRVQFVLKPPSIR